jgi:hypothetical protein
MVIECNSCHKKVGKPEASGGGIILLLAACITGVLLGVVAPVLTRHYHIQLPGWSLFLIGIPFWFFAAFILWELPRWLAYLRYGLRPCPSCGARNWGRPHYSGFGL